MTQYEHVQEAVAFIQKQTQLTPEIGMVLGTGLGGLADQIERDVEIPYDTIPHFPQSTVESHKGSLTLGTLAGKKIVVMEGRFHFYEGYSLEQVTFPIRVMKALGCSKLVLTNAAGGMNPQFALGDVMLIEDHINLLPDNPLRGVNDDRLGPRFPDMSQPYCKKLLEVSRQTALDLSIPHHPGVFVAVPGPNLETRAEYRMLKAYGADAVGMSTVPEVIVAAHAGLQTMAFSVITDLCLPDALEPVELSKILEVAAIGGERLTRLIPAIFSQLD